MTDPHQNNPHAPGRWASPHQSPVPQGSNQEFPQGQNQGLPGQNPFLPAGSPEPGPQSNSTKVSLIIIATMVVLTVIVSVLYFAVRDNNNDDNASATQPSTPQSADYGSNTLPDEDITANLDPRWAALLPASLIDHLVGCTNVSFGMRILDDPGNDVEADGAKCQLINIGSAPSHEVDILIHPDRIGYLLSVLHGEEPGATGEIFTQDGAITIGVSDVEAPFGTTLYYLDAATGLSVEITGSLDTDGARQTAQEIGIL